MESLVLIQQLGTGRIIREDRIIRLIIVVPVSVGSADDSEAVGDRIAAGKVKP